MVLPATPLMSLLSDCIVDVVEWSRALDVRLSEWCCSVTMVWVQIPSREEQNLTALKSNSNTVWFNFQTYIYITNLVCYTYFHWLFNPECQHIFGKQTGYICTFSVSLIWAPKNNNNVVDKNRNIYASLNQYHNTE